MARRGHDRRASVATATVDLKGIVTGWSEGAERVFGYSAADMVGRVATDLLAADAAAGGWCALGDAEVWSGTAALRHRDGHSLTLSLHAYPSLDGEGAVSGYVVAVDPEPPEHVDGYGGMLESVFGQASVAMCTFDAELRYQWFNDAAGQSAGGAVAVGGGAPLRGRKYADTVPDDAGSRGFLEHLRLVAETGTAMRYDDNTGRRAWTVEMWPVRDPAGGVGGVGIAAFDSSEQNWARQRLVLLNEAGACIGTTLDVVRTAEELTELVVPRLADFVSVDLLDSVLRGDEPTAGPVDAAVVLRRVAHRAAVEGVPRIAVPLGEIDTYPGFSPPARCLAAGRPVLSGVDDPDFLRWVAGDKVRRGAVDQEGIHSIMAVPLLARGLTLGVAVFIRIQRADPFQQDDLLLAEELAGRAAICVDNALRYTREHTTALTLQRSLLPHGLRGQTAVEVAFRYLPAGSQAGVGGDWFDVVPLSGTRVALVVGDVAGRGLHASATMGSLRMAVRTLADVDLPPDELLTHLDDLVAHLASGDEDDGDGDAAVPEPKEAGQPGQPDRHGRLGRVDQPVPVGEASATCLYAVYDPVSRRCKLASAGHLAPTVLYPDGTVSTVRIHPGPPLGVGGLPFEATELDLPEGSVLALYTDGLVEARDRDVDVGLGRLRRALAAPSRSLEETCDSMITSLLPNRPADDVALLLARTRALDANQVATWGLPVDPGVVADARAQASRQLAAWGLEEVAFITELVVSELITNAIRYGAPPIQLRLIRDRSLICEVSDGSNTAPHLRRAHVFEEGGRGLLLVSQLTQAWGTRQTTTGKTIWAEQRLQAAHS